ncbi:MAG: right-handed parallel beta-helix repeat-containing protein [Candidatus Sabulitectum sp.]|nr:right-handed parallel beta-helix repeat-containing protein [Candidatus Sabulitectum sp.]
MYSVFSVSVIVLLFAVLPGIAAGSEYVVSSQAEFLDAIGSDRTIVLDPGKIVLVEIPPPCDYECALFPSEHANPHVGYNWESDGVTVVVSDVSNMTIQGSGELASSLLTEPRYSFVIEFVDCSDLVISNLIAGHTAGGYCENGVFGFMNCNDVVISDCDLFGCGTVGLEIKDSSGFRFTDSVVRDCAYGIMEFRNSHDLLFENSLFIDNGEYYGVIARQCSGIEFTGCTFENSVLYECPPLFDLNAYGEISFLDCIVSDYPCEEVEGITLLPPLKSMTTERSW